MSVALITRGMIAGFAAAGGTGDPYPLPIEDIEVTAYDVKSPILEVDPEQEPTSPVEFDTIIEEYLPNKTSTIETLPTAGLRTFPTPRNL